MNVPLCRISVFTGIVSASLGFVCLWKVEIENIRCGIIPMKKTRSERMRRRDESDISKAGIMPTSSRWENVTRRMKILGETTRITNE